MPTEKPRVTITMTEDELKQIEDFRFGNKMKNQTQAILSLIKTGFAELERQQAEADNEIKKASEEAEASPETVKKTHIELFADVLGRAGLLNESKDLSDADMEFLKAMLLAIKAHFKDRQKNGD